MANYRGPHDDHFSPPARHEPAPIVTKLLQNGLAESVEKIVRKQVELVMEQMPLSSGKKRDHHGHRALVGSDKLELYNPDDPTANIERWILRIDELAERYGWSDFEKMYLLKSKLSGGAREWYNHLDTKYPDLIWEDWKKELWKAFGNQDNFAADLEELVARRKSLNESLTRYYTDKMILCQRCGIDGKKAVSCLIRGLPEEMRDEAYSLKFRTPEKFRLEFIEQCDDRVVKRGRFSPPAEAFDERSTRSWHSNEIKVKKCYNCQEWGTHLSRDCPQPRVLCEQCRKPGHGIEDCWENPANQRSTW